MAGKQISISTSRTHWRAGVYFVQGKPRVFDEEEFSKAQRALLDADPELLVEELEGVMQGSNEPLKRPESEADILLAIRGVILSGLSKTDFTQNGRPRVDALEQALGWKASSDEISSAMDSMTEEQQADLKTLLGG